MLRGEHRGRLRDLAVAFAARGAEVASGRDRDATTAEAERALDDGTALERFRSMVEAQGGDPRVVDDPAGMLPAGAGGDADRDRREPARSRRSPPRRSDSRAACWAPDACARATRSTPPWVSWCTARSATASRRGSRSATVHARSHDEARDAAAAGARRAVAGRRPGGGAAARARLARVRRRRSVGNFTALGFQLAAAMLVSLAIGMARARVRPGVHGGEVARPDAAAVGASHPEPACLVRAVRQRSRARS